MTYETTNKKRSTYSKVGCFLFVICINFCFLLVFRSLGKLIIDEQDLQSVFFGYVFIPLSCFVSGFFAYLITGKFIINSIASYMTGLFSYFILVKFAPIAFLWALLYYINAVLGYAIAFFSRKLLW